MQISSTIPAALAFLGLVLSPTAGHAGVEGNQYDVSVLIPSTGPPTQDCYAFNAGGDFCSASGQDGSWMESDSNLFGFWSFETADATLAGFHLVSTLIVGVGQTRSGLRMAAVGFAGGDCGCSGGSQARVSGFGGSPLSAIEDWRRSPAQR